MRSMILRVGTVGAIWLLLHVWLGARLLGTGALTGAPLVAGWAGVVLLALAPFGSFFTRRYERVGFTALGFSSILIVLVLVSAVLQIGAWGLEAGTVSLSLVGSATLLTLAGSWHARRPGVVRVDVPIAHLPADLERLRIVQLSDLHVGPTLKRDFVEAVVDTTNGLSPDVVVLTGDLADGLPHALRNDVAPLARLVAPLGKFFVTGNHEYYWDAAGWLREVGQLGFESLGNAHRLLRRGSGRVLLAGVTDRAPDPFASVHNAPESDVRVLLAHQPKSAFAARAAGFDLQISGHTHGGQYFPFNLLVRLFQPFVAGLHRLEEMWLYVSRGTGYWGPPLRLGAPSEITVIELVRA